MKKVIAIIIIAAVVLGGLYYYVTTQKEDTKEISETTLEAVLKDASDLTTQELIYTDVLELQKGSIPLINKDKFIIKYTADISAGFDIQDADLDLTDEKLTITIPHSTIQDINISQKNVKIIDTNFSIIDGGKQATLEAMAKAEDHAGKYAKKSELLDKADQNAENLMEGLYTEVVGDREIEVNFK